MWSLILNFCNDYEQSKWRGCYVTDHLSTLIRSNPFVHSMQIVSEYPVRDVSFVATSISKGSYFIAKFLPKNGLSHKTCFNSQDLMGQFTS